MGIDGIGKPGGAPPIGSAIGPSAAQASEAFRTELASTTVDRAEPVDALAQLQRGEIALTDYLDVRVRAAVEHLVGRVSPEQLEFVKQSLRDQLTSDPVLIELVRRTTGAIPSASEA